MLTTLLFCAAVLTPRAPHLATPEGAGEERLLHVLDEELYDESSMGGAPSIYVAPGESHFVIHVVHPPGPLELKKRDAKLYGPSWTVTVILDGKKVGTRDGVGARPSTRTAARSPGPGGPTARVARGSRGPASTRASSG